MLIYTIIINLKPLCNMFNILRIDKNKHLSLLVTASRQRLWIVQNLLITIRHTAELRNTYSYVHWSITHCLSMLMLMLMLKLKFCLITQAYELQHF